MTPTPGRSPTTALATGTALDVSIESDSYDTSVSGRVPVVDAPASCDERTWRTVLFLVSRGQVEDTTVTVPPV